MGKERKVYNWFVKVDENGKLLGIWDNEAPYQKRSIYTWSKDYQCRIQQDIKTYSLSALRSGIAKANILVN